MLHTLYFKIVQKRFFSSRDNENYKVNFNCFGAFA